MVGRDEPAGTRVARAGPSADLGQRTTHVQGVVLMAVILEIVRAHDGETLYSYICLPMAVRPLRVTV